MELAFKRQHMSSLMALVLNAYFKIVHRFKNKTFIVNISSLKDGFKVCK
jgi:hypothetical protein